MTTSAPLPQSVLFLLTKSIICNFACKNIQILSILQTNHQKPAYLSINNHSSLIINQYINRSSLINSCSPTLVRLQTSVSSVFVAYLRFIPKRFFCFVEMVSVVSRMSQIPLMSSSLSIPKYSPLFSLAIGIQNNTPQSA